MQSPSVAHCRNCGRTANPSDRFCGLCGESLGPSATEIVPPPQSGPHVDRILEALRAATLGEYDIAGELGRGGMAVVFLAHDIQLNRRVAIKALLPELLYTEGMDLRFKQEARVAAKLDHPNILVIYGVRESKDLLYIVTKLVDGRPLSSVLRQSGPLPIPVARHVIHQIADALNYAHGEGVVHRDVKPANVMVERRGNLVVMDFGIAKAVDEANLTRTGLVIGTPAYMSPEQCLAGRVTSAADQYSLGTMAYELLTGRTPFQGSVLEMQWAHTRETPEPVRTLRPDCPEKLEALVSRMLAKQPEDRWLTLQQVVDATAIAPAEELAARQYLAALVTSESAPPLRVLPSTPVSPLLAAPAALDASPVDVPAAAVTVDPAQRVPVDHSAPLQAVSAGTSRPSMTWRVATAATAVVVLGAAVLLFRHPWRTAVVTAEAPASQPVPSRPSTPNDSLATVPATSSPVTPAPRRDTARVTTPAAGGTSATTTASQTVQARTAASREPVLPRSAGVVALDVSPPRALPDLAPGDSSRIVVHALDADRRDIPPDRITWRSSADGVASVSATGWVKAIAPGETEILIGADTMKQSVSVRVVLPRAAGGVVAGASIPPKVSETQQPAASAPDKGAPAPRTTDAAASGRAPSTARRDTVASTAMPVLTQAVADTIFNALAAVINARALGGVSGVFAGGAQAGDAQMQRDFLTFLRDAKPLASVQRVHVGSPEGSGVGLTSAMHFTWRNQTGRPYDRLARFSGLAVHTSDGWALRDVRLLTRFW